MIKISSMTRVELSNGAYRASGSTELRSLVDCAWVARFGEVEDGYQRPLTERKVADVAACLEVSPIIDGALTVFVSEDAEPHFDRAKKCLTFADIPKAFEIVDGQHRFYGAQRYLAEDASRRVRMDVQYYCGSNRKAAAAKFHEIHRTATRVHTGILAEAERRAGHLDGWKAEAAGLYDTVLNGLAFDGRRGVNLNTWTRAIRPHVISGGSLGALSQEAKNAVLTGYIEAAHQSLGDVVKRPTVLAALLALLPDVVAKTRAAHGSVKAPALATVLTPLKDMDVFAGGRSRDAVMDRIRAAVLPVALSEDDV